MASAGDLYALAGSQFESPFVFWRRLNRLWHAGYLMRPPAQQWRLRQKPGNTELLYMLGNKGAVELERLGFTLPRIDWDQKAKDIQPFSFDHPLLITRFLTCFSLGVQRTPGLQIAELIAEGKFHDTVTFFDGAAEVTLPIKPDATVVVEDRRDGRTERLGIFHEAQRRTMPLQRGPHSGSPRFIESIWRISTTGSNGTASKSGSTWTTLLSVSRAKMRPPP